LWCSMYPRCHLRSALWRSTSCAIFGANSCHQAPNQWELNRGCIVHIEAVPVNDDDDSTKKKMRSELNHRIIKGHSFSEEDMNEEIGRGS
jgi:hypothetical protein